MKDEVQGSIYGGVIGFILGVILPVWLCVMAIVLVLLGIIVLVFKGIPSGRVALVIFALLIVFLHVVLSPIWFLYLPLALFVTPVLTVVGAILGWFKLKDENALQSLVDVWENLTD